MFIDFGYIPYYDLEENHPDLVPLTSLGYVDDTEWEKFLHAMPQEYNEILVCLHMGFKPAEIVEILQYPNIARFYNVSVQMRSFFRKQKKEFFEL